MNFKKHIKEQDFKNKIRNQIYKYSIYEGIYDVGSEESEDLRPDLKYYAFDWDDNLMYMPTKIMVMSENDDEIGMSTEDFAEHRHQIGVEDFKYKGSTIVGYSPDPFIYFKEAGENKFLIDSMIAPVGPAWNDFVECLNGGSLFAIITARGHSPQTLRKGIFNLIAKNHNGINKSEMIKNLKRYHEMISKTKNLKEDIDSKKFEADFNGSDLVLEYLDRCLMAPVTYGQGSAANPEEGKKVALRKFISDCRQSAKELVQSLLDKNPNLKLSDLVPKFKNDVSFNEVMDDIDIDEFITQNVKIGFSDDDLKNAEAQRDMLSQEYPNEPINVYYTKGGEKRKFN
jgi:hypothetical protein